VENDNYWMYLSDVGEDNDEMSSLLREAFWSGIRASLYKSICKGGGGFNQWAFITGKKTRDSHGRKIRLFDESIAAMQKVVDYLESTEGQDELKELGITNCPDSPDALMSIICDVKTTNEVKRDEFRAFLSHKHKVLEYLSRVI
jgi:hypothetical protein